MANDLNQVVLIGRLTRDPELRQIPSGQSVCSFSIANNRNYVSNGEKREEASFFDCTAWGRLAEIINQYCIRGKQIAIQGRLRQNTYENKEGQRVSKIEIVVENMQLLGRSNETQGGGYGSPAASGQSFGTPAGYPAASGAGASPSPMASYAPPQPQMQAPLQQPPAPAQTDTVPPFPSPATPSPAPTEDATQDFGEDDIPF